MLNWQWLQTRARKRYTNQVAFANGGLYIWTFLNFQLFLLDVTPITQNFIPFQQLQKPKTLIQP